MKHKTGALSLSIALLVSAPISVAAEPRIGAVVQRDYLGAVAAPNGSATAHPIQFNDPVFALDTVKTGATGATALEFLDETTVEVGAGAEIRLDGFVYDPQTAVGGGNLSFAVGAFRYVGGKMTTEHNIRLHTPTATMVIRGTELVIYVWPDGRTEVNVISGAVEVMACDTGGAGQLAMSGMQVTVMPTCTSHVSAAPSLPEGMAALELPERKAETDPDDPDDIDRHDPADRPSPPSRDPGNSSGGPSSSGG